MRMHSQIESEEMVERYVLGQLAPEERQAFEEHFLACDACFENVKDVERLRAGIHDAVARGVLKESVKASQAAWWRWAFAATACTTTALAVVVGWVLTEKIPALRQELHRTTAQVESERQARADLEQKFALLDRPEPNVPLIVLEASRAAEKPSSVTLAGGSSHLIVWIEIGQTRYRRFQMEIFGPDNKPVLLIDHLERSVYGALAASLPAEQLPRGVLRIRVSGLEPPPSALVAEYQLRIERR